MMEKDQYMNSIQVSSFLKKHLNYVFSNSDFSSDTHTPICLWGEAGIGKTELVRDIVRASGWSFVHLSLAQIEESGDILGLPYLKDTETGKKTAFAKPEWVPDTPGPGVLLIDDFNRADTRILNAFMEVFQFYRTSSWSLPKDWFIILTANPMSSQYYVQKVDQAVMDRIMHIHMRFDLEAWISWAEDQGFDQHLLFFPLLFPEQFAQSTLSPRAWSKLFRHLSALDDKEEDQKKTLINMVLPKEEAMFFMQFMQANQRPLLSPDRLIDLSQEQMDAYLEDLQEKYQQPLLIHAIGRSILTYLKEDSIRSHAGKTLNRFWLSKNLPADVRLEQLTYLEEHLNSTEKTQFSLAEIQDLMLELRG